MAGEGALEALGHHGALPADGLGLGDVLQLLGEEDLGEGAIAHGAGGQVSPVLLHRIHHGVQVVQCGQHVG